MDYSGSLLKAVAFAAEKHRRQRRKDPEATPYINHPITVAELLWNVGGVRDSETLQAALLHDTVEDTATTPEELEEIFGPRVRILVAEVTDDKSLPKKVRKELQIQHAPHLSSGARVVKLADKIANVQDIVEVRPKSWSPQRCWEYLQWARNVVDGLRGANEALEAEFDELYQRGMQDLGWVETTQMEQESGSQGNPNEMSNT